ncbi:MAG: hypothetical protein KDH15_07545, partial [Rhodocyclaceae bacterium]|nr:hypothetical protein [Rhodocyclaceae bacterium]
MRHADGGGGGVTADEPCRFVHPRCIAGSEYVPPTTPRMCPWNPPRPIALTYVRRDVFGVGLDREDIDGGRRWLGALIDAVRAACAAKCREPATPWSIDPTLARNLPRQHDHRQQTDHDDGQRRSRGLGQSFVRRQIEGLGRQCVEV